MRNFLLTTLVLLSVTLCYAQEKPTVNLPEEMRETNNGTRYIPGNCVHCSFVNLLRWQGQYAWADWWIENHDGGAGPYDLAFDLDAAGIDYAHTIDEKDVAFLEKACATRRGACVAIWNPKLYGYNVRKTRRNPKGEMAHMVCLVYMDDEVVGILDNNFDNHIIYVEREAFLDDWKSESWAITPLMGPPAPPQLRR